MRYLRFLVYTFLFIVSCSSLFANSGFSKTDADSYLKTNTMAMMAEVPPATPGAITGDEYPWVGISQTYSISAVSGATGYQWLLPSGMSFASNSGTSISVNVTSSVNGSIQVRAYNSYGYSSYRSIAVKSPSVTVTRQCEQSYVNRTYIDTYAKFYLQTSSTGTSTANELPKTITTDGQYYVRIYDSRYGWSNSKPVILDGYDKPSSVSISGGSTCVTDMPQITAVTVPSTAAVKWYSEDGFENSNKSFTPDQAQNTVNIYEARAYIDNETCYTSSEQTIQRRPAVPTVTGTTKYCHETQATVSLNISDPGGATYAWYLNSSTIKSSTENLSVTHNAGASYSYQARAYISGTNCYSSNVVTATINKRPEDATYSGVTEDCGAFSTTLTASNETSGAKFDWHLGSDNVPESPNTNTKNVSLSNGQEKEYTIRSYLVDNSCYSSEVVNLESKSKPTSVDISGVSSSCYTSTPQITASTNPSTALVKWYSGGSYITSSKTFTPSQSAGTSSTYQVRAYIDDPACYVSDQETINKSPTVPTLSGTTTFCEEVEATTDNKITGPGGMVYEWYLNNSTRQSTTENLIVDLDAGASYTMYARAYVPGTTCYSSTNTSITVNKKPTSATIDGTTNSTECVDSKTLTVSTSPSTASVKWYCDGSVVSTNKSFTPTQSANTIKQYEARTYVNNIGCSTSAYKTVQKRPSVPTVTGETNYCDETAATIDLTISAPEDVAYKWYLNSSTLKSSTENLEILHTAGASYNYQARAYITGTSCYSNKVVTATINKRPELATVSGTTEDCGTFSTTLTASNGTSGAKFDWHLGANSTPESPNTAIKNVSLSNGQEKQYTVRSYLVDNSCYSSEAVNLESKEKPTGVSIGGITNNCVTTMPQITANTTPSTASVNWYTNGSFETSSKTFTPSQSAGTSSTYQARAYVDDPGCYITAQETINRRPAAPTLSGTTLFCEEDKASTNNKITAPGGMTYEWWYLDNSTRKSTTENLDINLDAGANYTMSARAYVPGTTDCFSYTNTTITVNTQPAAPTISGDASQCENENKTLTTSTTTSGDITYNWYKDGYLIDSDVNTYSPEYVSGVSNTYTTRAYLESSSCYSTSIGHSFQNKITPAVPVGVTDYTCGAGDVYLTATSTTPGVSFQWIDGNTIETTNEFTVSNVTQTRPVNVKSLKDGCLSAASSVNAVYKIQPVLTSYNGDERVEQGVVNLTAATDNNGGTIEWYLASNTTETVGEGASYSPAITVKTPYKVRAALDVCTTPFYDITGIINALEYSYYCPQSVLPAGIIGSGVTLDSDYILRDQIYVGGEYFSRFYLYPNPGKLKLELECNSTWEVTKMPSWISLGEEFSESGTNDTYLEFNFPPFYNEQNTREDYIEFKIGQDTYDKIYLKQDPKTLIGAVSGGTINDNNIKSADVYLSTNTINLEGGGESLEYNLTNYASSINIEITADEDVSWQLEALNPVDGDSWVSQPTISAGEGNAVVTFPITTNFGGKRTATINLLDDVNTVYSIHLVQQSVADYASTTPMNYVKTTAYGEEGRILGQSIQYYNKLGKPTQSIARDLSKNMVVAAQVAYDDFGRPWVSSLPAAVDQQNLNFILDFLEANTLNAEGEITSNTKLGRYYSSENTDEPYVPEDKFAFTKTLYSQTIPGAVRKAYMPGKETKDKSGTAFTLNASPDEITKLVELNYINLKTLKSAEEANLRADYMGMTKLVGKDVMGKESVTYYNAEGQAIASAMTSSTGTARKYAITNTIKTDGEVGYVDFHLPKDGQGKYTLKKDHGWEGELVNLETDLSVPLPSYTSTTIADIDPGFYRMICLKEAAEDNLVTITYNLEYKNFSFTAYDDAGRVTRSISPGDMQNVIENSSVGDNENIDNLLDKQTNQTWYGKFGRVDSTYSPDEGLSYFAYRKDGSIRCSQNEEQRKTNSLSYTNYDEHGRIVEVGEYKHNLSNDIMIDLMKASEQNFINLLEATYTAGSFKATIEGIGELSYQTYTLYGEADVNLPRSQKFLRGRVSKTWNDNSATWYSYNYDGTVDWTVQEITGLDIDNDQNSNNVLTVGIEDTDDLVTLDYTYDFTGNVTEVTYQKYKPDEFMHFYEYDFDNRLQTVYTKSNTNVVMDYDGRWRLNNQLKDDSQNQNDGTANNGACLTSDRFENENQAYTFDGKDDFIGFNQDYVFTETDPWTVSMWIDWEGYSTNGTLTLLFGKENAYGDFFALQRGGINRFSLRNTSAAYYSFSSGSTNALYNTGWNKLTIVADGNGNLSAFINGEHIETISAVTSFRFNAIGKAYPTTAYSYNGKVDDIRIYERALSSDEISDIYFAENLPEPEKTLHAKYHYYQHGPLKRVEYGENLQGVDYVYNIQGWLKSINNPNGTDPGSDGSGNHANFAADIFAMTLNYYNDDYARTGISLGNVATAANYDGNIAEQQWVNKGLDVDYRIPAAWKYSYDERNYLASATFGTYQANAYVYSNKYKVDNLTYDANGNIQSLIRNDATGAELDNLSYGYEKDNVSTTPDLINKLTTVTDEAHFNSMEDMGTSSYQYNAIGQLTDDSFGKDGTGHRFTYDVYGKVTEVHDGANSIIARYTYNEAGFRIKKYDASTGTEKITWYTRDASGNIIGTYTEEAGSTNLTEQPIYGSGRIGLATPDGSGIISKYSYELTDHLGNVRATFGKTSDGLLSINTATDYYPFGMTMDGRTYQNAENYRFGFQGQFAEEDPETGYTAFESRLLDKRLGRWLTTDPAGQFWSPYLAMGNNPINGVDPDGEKWYESTSNPGTFEWFTGWQSFKAFMSSDWSMTPRGGTTTNFGSGWTTTAEPVTITGSIPNMVKSPWGGMMLNPVKFGNYNPGTISQYVPNFFGRIEESTLGQTFVGKAVYGVVDDAYVYSTSFIYGPSGARHLNRSGVVGSELQDAGISTLTNFVPIGKMGSALGIGKKTLNAGQFNALYKGSGITAATGGGVQIRAYNQAIRTHTGFQKAFTWFGIGTTAVGATQK